MPASFQRWIVAQRLRRDVERMGHRLPVVGQIADEAEPMPRLLAAIQAGAGTKLADRLHGPMLLQYVQLSRENILGSQVGRHFQHLQLFVEHSQGERGGDRLMGFGDFGVAAADRGADGGLVNARLADLGVRRHDDLLAGERDENGVPFDRFGNIGDCFDAAQFAAGDIAGQLMGFVVVAPPASFCLAGPELEDHDGPRTAGGRFAQQPRHFHLHARGNAAVDRDRNAD